MKTVAMDLGASETRYMGDMKRVVVPNNMEFLDFDTNVDLEPYDDRLTSALDIRITAESALDGVFPVHVLMGKMAQRHSSNNVRPSIMSNKHTQAVNYISAIVAAACSRITAGTEEDVRLYVALPPLEVKTAKDIFRNNIIGKYKVEFMKYPMGSSTTVELNIFDVQCHEESVMAAASFFFNLDLSIKEEAKDMMNGTYLSVDIGASTSDLALIVNGKYDDKSGKTYKVGGMIARDNMIEGIRARYGFELPIDKAELAMKEGRIQLGNKYVEIRDIIAEAKIELASAITNAIQTYFSIVGTPIQLINGILVSGGGSMESQYINESGDVVVTSKSLSSFVTDKMQSICSGIDVISYGADARFANVKGLFIRSIIDEKTGQFQTSEKRSVNTVQAAQPVAKAPVESPKPVEVAAQPAQPAQPVVETGFTAVEEVVAEASNEIITPAMQGAM